MKKCRKNYNRTSSNKETNRKDHGQWGKQFSSIGPKGSNSRTYSQIEVKLDSCRNEIRVVMKEAFHDGNIGRRRMIMMIIKMMMEMTANDNHDNGNFVEIMLHLNFLIITTILLLPILPS